MDCCCYFSVRDHFSQTVGRAGALMAGKKVWFQIIWVDIYIAKEAEINRNTDFWKHGE